MSLLHWKRKIGEGTLNTIKEISWCATRANSDTKKYRTKLILEHKHNLFHFLLVSLDFFSLLLCADAIVSASQLTHRLHLLFYYLRFEPYKISRQKNTLKSVRTRVLRIGWSVCFFSSLHFFSSCSYCFNIKKKIFVWKFKASFGLKITTLILFSQSTEKIAFYTFWNVFFSVSREHFTHCLLFTTFDDASSSTKDGVA